MRCGSGPELKPQRLALGAIAVLGLGAAALALLWQERDGAAAAGPGTPPPALAAGPGQGGASAAASASAAYGAESAASAALAASASQALAALPAAQALRQLKSCYFKDSCQLAGPEGLDEHFAVSRALVAQLQRLGESGNTAEQAAWARELLSFPDGHVQAAALALAARLPPSAETVGAAVAALGESYDAVLLRQAYPVLQQWQQLGLNAGYDEMFLKLVHTGGWQAAQSVAENIGPFLNAGNVARFEQIANQLQPGARQEALKRALRDYQLLRSGA